MFLLTSCKFKLHRSIWALNLDVINCFADWRNEFHNEARPIVIVDDLFRIVHHFIKINSNEFSIWMRLVFLRLIKTHTYKWRFFFICKRNDHHKSCYKRHWSILQKKRSRRQSVYARAVDMFFNRFIHLTPLFFALYSQCSFLCNTHETVVKTHINQLTKKEKKESYASCAKYTAYTCV